MPRQSGYVFRNRKLVTESCPIDRRCFGLPKDVTIIKNDFFGRITSCAWRLGRGRSCGRGRRKLFGRCVTSVQARSKHHFPQRPENKQFSATKISYFYKGIFITFFRFRLIWKIVFWQHHFLKQYKYFIYYPLFIGFQNMKFCSLIQAGPYFTVFCWVIPPH